MQEGKILKKRINELTEELQLIKYSKKYQNNVEENKKLYLFIKSLENTPNYLESKKYKIYVEIFETNNL